VSDVANVPSEYVGLWRRDSFVQPDGRRDVTTEVYWLQSHGLYVDLRIPAGRPDFRGFSDLASLPPAHLEWLRKQEGFAGRLSVNGGICHWRRDLDYQPPGAFDDIGQAHFISESVLLETGVLVDYAEIWRKAVLNGVDRHADQVLAARSLPDEQGRLGFWVVVGDVFMYAIDRPNPFEPHADGAPWTLDDFGCEIGFGRVEGSLPWQIDRCSMPFAEGGSLFPGGIPACPEEGEEWLAPADSPLAQAGGRWRVETACLSPQLFAACVRDALQHA